MKMRPAHVACLLLLGTMLASCDEPGGDSALLPARSAAVDTTAVTDSLRQFGGDVFVNLTGAPDDAVLLSLRQAGLEAPAGHDAGPVSLPPVLPNTVWGHVAAGGIRRLAMLPFVLLVEPTADSTGINPL